MKKEDLQNAFSDLDDKFIKESIETEKKTLNISGKKVGIWVCAAACFVAGAVILTVYLTGNNKNTNMNHGGTASPSETTTTPYISSSPYSTPSPEAENTEDYYILSVINTFFSQNTALPEGNLPSATESPMSYEELDIMNNLLKYYLENKIDLFGENSLDIKANIDEDGKVTGLNLDGGRLTARCNLYQNLFFIRNNRGQKIVCAFLSDETNEPYLWCEYNINNSKVKMNGISKDEYNINFEYDKNKNCLTDLKNSVTYYIEQSGEGEQNNPTASPVPVH